MGRDERAQVHHTLDRHEVWDADGTLRTTRLRRHRTRWWTPARLAELLRECGYDAVETTGSEEAFVAFAHRGRG